MSHLDRKELKRPDAFLSRAERIIDFINKNSRAILATIALVIGIGFVSAMYAKLRADKNHTSTSELYVAQQALSTALPQGAKAADWEQIAAKPIADLEKISKDFKGTTGAFEALLLLGDTFYDHGNSAKAVEYFERAVQSAPSKTNKVLAQHSLAYALEDTKRHDEAIVVLQDILKSREKALKGDVVMALARNYELKGDKAKAAEQYDRAIREFPGTPVARSAEAQKRQLQ